MKQVPFSIRFSFFFSTKCAMAANPATFYDVCPADGPLLFATSLAMSPLRHRPNQRHVANTTNHKRFARLDE